MLRTFYVIVINHSDVHYRCDITHIPKRGQLKLAQKQEDMRFIEAELLRRRIRVNMLREASAPCYEEVLDCSDDTVSHPRDCCVQ